jgi:heterodisulfide reductase subunit B
MSEYAYFPGCSLRATGMAYEKSLLEVFRILGLKLNEIEDWNCCGATSYMSIDEDAAFVLSARNLALAAKQGASEVVAPCSACYLVLRKTEDYATRYPTIRKRVDEALQIAELPPIDWMKVRHPVEVLFNDVGVGMVKAKTVRKWQGGKLACYYGCQMLRPYYETDRPQDPIRMDELMHAAGATTIQWALKTKCCGGSLTGTIREVGVRLNEILIAEAVRKGAEAIVTCCPLCQFNLDAYQREMNGGRGYDIPILYFTQVLGWALGADRDKLGFQHSIAGGKVLKQWFPAREEVMANA